MATPTIDLVITRYTGSEVVVLRNDASSWSERNLATAVNPEAIALGDFDNDGVLDIAAAVRANTSATVFRGMGAAMYGTGTLYAVGSMPGAIVAGQFDNAFGDDLAIANWGDQTLTIYRSNGASFGTASTIQLFAKPLTLVAGDLDADGALDLLVGANEELRVLRGDGAGGFTIGPPLASSGALNSATLVDVDGNTTLDIITGNGSIFDGALQVDVYLANCR